MPAAKTASSAAFRPQTIILEKLRKTGRRKPERRRLPCRQGPALQYPRKAERRKYAPRPRRPSLAWLARLFGARRERAALRPLYDALVAAAREPAWYREGGVPDTIEGRFDMVATMVALVLLRLEREGEKAKSESVQLTEIFIDDMDGTLRQRS